MKEHKAHRYSEIREESINVESTLNMMKMNLIGLKSKIKLITDRLNNVMNNFEAYFKLIERNVRNYNENKINYFIMTNIEYINKTINDEDFYNDITEILDDLLYSEDKSRYKEFIPQILNIYNKMNKNEIDLVYNIPKDAQKVNIFGYHFVKRNKDICKIIYENKEYDLNDSFDCKSIKNNVLKIKLEGINNAIILDDMFKHCSELSDQSDFSNWDTSYVISMTGLFRGCSLEKIPDISKFNTSNVICMAEMFSGCSHLISLPDISRFNTSNLIIMREMFYFCSSLKSLPDLSKWDITNALKIKGVLNLDKILENCPESLNIPEKFKNINSYNDINSIQLLNI